MMETRIETRFGAAVRSVERQYGRGLQARLSDATGMESSNLSQIIKRDKRTSEEVRRKIYGECARLVPRYAIGYDGFLDFGGLLLSGVSENAALEQVRAARYSLHIPRISGQAYTTTGSGCIVQNGVNNGTMTAGGPQDGADIITDNLCQMIREYMLKMDLDQRIDLRARVRDMLLGAGKPGGDTTHGQGRGASSGSGDNDNG